jgi:hypothetical protein
MPFAEEMLARLKPLAIKLIELEMYGYLSDVADLLVCFKSGNWPRLADEDQEEYLKKMGDTFHVRGMGDSELFNDPNYQFVLERVGHELQAVRRRMC